MADRREPKGKFSLNFDVFCAIINNRLFAKTVNEPMCDGRVEQSENKDSQSDPVCDRSCMDRSSDGRLRKQEI